jgi:hypothetical protein
MRALQQPPECCQEKNMKAKTVLFTLAICLAAAGLVMAKTNPNMGTWKLNEAKSKFPAGAPKNHTVSYEAAGDDIKVTVDGTDGSGAATHNEWTGKFDGKCYAVTGDSTADQRCYRIINSRTMTFTNNMAGKVVLNGRIVISMNGKMRTVTTTTRNAKGKRVTSTAVYDKQ